MGSVDVSDTNEFDAQLALPSLLPPLAPPPELFGRDEIVATVGRLLTERRVVAIEGIAGSGKSALLAKLVQQSGLNTCWIEVLPGLCDDGNDLCWQIAQPLAQLAPHAFEELRYAIRDGVPLAAQLQLILDTYATLAKPLLLCIDSLEHARTPSLESVLFILCERAARAGQDAHLALLVAGRSLPFRMHQYALPPLPGLVAADIATWAAHNNLLLTEAQCLQIEAATGGLPQAVQLLLELLSKRGHSASLDSLIDSRPIDRFLWNVIERLPGDERALLRSITRSGVPTQVSFEEREVLMRLEKKHLVNVLLDERIDVHPLLRRFILRSR